MREEKACYDLYVNPYTLLNAHLGYTHYYVTLFSVHNATVEIGHISDESSRWTQDTKNRYGPWKIGRSDHPIIGLLLFNVYEMHLSLFLHVAAMHLHICTCTCICHSLLTRKSILA